MIRSLTGTVTHSIPGGIILEVGGVGYLVAVPVRSVPAVGAATTLCIHHHIREQDQSLYGFASLDELAAFEQLLNVPSIGPKSALAILSIATPADLERAIEADDVGFFSSVPGIGKKSAAKIIVELKGKLAPAESTGASELREALTGLGYAPRDIDPLIRSVPSTITETTEQIRWILGQLSR